MKIDMTGIGRRIKQARERKGIRQEALAEAAGISQNHLSHIENAKSSPSLEVLGRIMVYLEVQPNEIFCETVGTAVPYLWDEAGKKLGDVGMEDLLRINTSQQAKEKVIELAKLLKRRMEDTSE